LARLDRLDGKYFLKVRTVIEASGRGDAARRIHAAGWRTAARLPAVRIRAALDSDDPGRVGVLAQRIAQRLERQGIADVAFDARLYPFVKTQLAPRLPDTATYHVRGGPSLASGAFLEALEANPAFQDNQVRALFVPFESPFAW